jgi:hypothetical protein
MKTSLSRITITSICSNGGRVVVVILKEHGGGVERTSGGANQLICLSYLSSVKMSGPHLAVDDYFAPQMSAITICDRCLSFVIP